ncbi:MAG: antitoxin [Chlamydiales bacterium]
MSGHSQAIRLPKEFQFHSKEVAIAKKGKKLIIWEIPKNLGEAYHLLTNLPEDFFAEGRLDEPPQERELL